MPDFTKREAIKVSFNNADLIRVMSEGDEKASKIVKDILQDPFLGGHKAVLTLDDMNIRGAQLTAAFDYCGSLPSLLGCIMTRDGGMVRHLNELGLAETATPSGASFQRKPSA